MTDSAADTNLRNPRLWRLGLALDAATPSVLEAVAFPTAAQAPLMRMQIPLPDHTLQSPHKALEEAVYANPILLGDFARTDIVLRTTRFVIVPLDVQNPHTDPVQLAETAAAAGLLANDIAAEAVNYHVLESDVPTAGVKIIYAVPSEVDSFLRRTFPGARLHHHLEPLARYFSAKNRDGNTIKTYVHFHSPAPGRAQADILGFDRNGTPGCITTADFSNEMDGAYYILAAATAAGFSPESGQLMVCGDNALRAKMVPVLRRFATYVMPVIFPSALFRLGKDAIHAPFPLTLIPLCE